MNELARHLRRRIRLTGPMTVADFMAAALGHPRVGFYMRGDPFGTRGDYTTAPEISQMFGELIGVWVRAVWETMGRPDPCRLVELGPGRGTLMADALRALGPARDAADLHLVETSPAMRAIQQATLAGGSATWHAAFDDVPGGPLLVVANELFDALPIRQIERTPSGWRERMVGVDERDGFRFALAPGPAPCDAPDAAIGTVIEVAPVALALAGQIAGRVVRHGGAALIIDFAATQSGRPTLQAVRDHARADPLDDPGTVDLAAAVDFAGLARAGREDGARVFGPMGQGAFLANLGIAVRADRLKARATPAQAAAIDAAHRRLVDADAMGRLFQVLAFAHPSLATLPGFEPC